MGKDSKMNRKAPKGQGTRETLILLTTQRSGFRGLALSHLSTTIKIYWKIRISF